MEIISNSVVYLIVFCAVIAGIASIFKPNSDLGKQFTDGIHAMGELFIPIAGIMASLPILSKVITTVIGPAYSFLGSDSAMAATTLLAVDMGGYPLAQTLAQTNESFIMATVNGYMAGATIVFTIPIALQILPKKYYRELSIGTMIGFLTIPFGVFITMMITYFINPEIRTVVSTVNTGSESFLYLDFYTIFRNLIPLIILCSLLAYGLYKFPNKMIKGFAYFGKGVESYAKLIIILVIVQMFTGLLTEIPLDPVIADVIDQNRALEVTGYIALMLCGAFSFVYIIQTYLQKPLEKIGSWFGWSKELTSGVVAASANSIAAFNMIDDTIAEIDIISIIAFSVCGAFVIGDHLAFSANFQPNMMIPIMIGKLTAGILGILLVRWLYKKTKLFKKEERYEVK